MKRFLLGVALFATAFGVPTAHATSKPATFPITIVDDRGNHVHFTQAPKRIVSLFADYTEMLFALGLEKRVVGNGSKYAEFATGTVDAAGKPREFRFRTEWPSKLGRDYPIRAPEITHVEGGFATQPFDLETITSLQPDLIVAPFYSSQDTVYQKMRTLGFKIIFLNPSTVGGVIKDLALLGRATGTEAHASAVVQIMKSQLAQIRARVAHAKSRPAVYYEIDATNPLQPYTAGPGTIPDQAIHLAHARNIADSVSSCSGTSCYPAFNTETIIASNPQVIVLADVGSGVTLDSVQSRAGYDSIAAVKSHRVVAINPDLLSKFGPRIVIGVQAIAKLVHPEAFKKK